MGLLTPLGLSVQETWTAVVNGKSGIRFYKDLEDAGCLSHIAGRVDSSFSESAFGPKERKMPWCIRLAMHAADQALSDSGYAAKTLEQQDRSGVFFGTGFGALDFIGEQHVKVYNGGVRKCSPFFVPYGIAGAASGYVSTRIGFKGPNQTVVTACASGSHAVALGASFIQSGSLDVALVGGFEGLSNIHGNTGFEALRALSTGFNHAPETASRPWDKKRDGFVVSEGAGMLILEDLEHAQARGARIYATLSGHAASSDAYHATAPDPKGDGAFRAMRRAISAAGLVPDDIGYVNAHGTSTPLGDQVELVAIQRLFGDRSDANPLYVSSTKSALGHTLGAAGAVEAIVCVCALSDSVAPPTLNLDEPLEMETPLVHIDLVPHVAKPVPNLKHVLSNSFGFGGTNGALVLSKF